jgi:nucleotide-binding universal stress UspA family protein
MNQILIPTDFSDCANEATEVAFEIAKKTDAKILFLHSLEVPTGWVMMPKDLEDHYPDVQKQIGQSKNQLIEMLKIAKRNGVEATQSLAFSDSYKDVTQTLKDKNHDLIIIGSQGRKGVDSFFLGSVAAKIMRVAKTPVLIIKKRPENLRFKTIVFASGLEDDTHEAFGRLLNFAKDIGAENLHFVEITTPHNFKPSKIVRDKMEAFVNAHDYKMLQLHNYNHYNVESGIIEFAQNVRADMIALATHGRSGLSSLFIESIPENLVKYSEFPILSIRV